MERPTECTLCLETLPARDTTTFAATTVCKDCVRLTFQNALDHEYYYKLLGKINLEVLKYEHQGVLSREFVRDFLEKTKEYDCHPADRRIFCLWPPGRAAQLSEGNGEGEQTKGRCNRFLGPIASNAADALRNGGILVVRCKDCDKLSCRLCAGRFEDSTHKCVPAASADNDNEAFKGLKRGKHFQLCPSKDCGLQIELAAACNHIVCPCGMGFCFICGEPATASSGHWVRRGDTSKPSCPRFSQPDAPKAIYDVEHHAGTDLFANEADWLRWTPAGLRSAIGGELNAAARRVIETFEALNLDGPRRGTGAQRQGAQEAVDAFTASWAQRRRDRTSPPMAAALPGQLTGPSDEDLPQPLRPNLDPRLRLQSAADSFRAIQDADRARERWRDHGPLTELEQHQLRMQRIRERAPGSRRQQAGTNTGRPGPLPPGFRFGSSDPSRYQAPPPPPGLRPLPLQPQTPRSLLFGRRPALPPYVAPPPQGLGPLPPVPQSPHSMLFGSPDLPSYPLPPRTPRPSDNATSLPSRPLNTQVATFEPLPEDNSRDSNEALLLVQNWITLAEEEMSPREESERLVLAHNQRQPPMPDQWRIDPLQWRPEPRPEPDQMLRLALNEVDPPLPEILPLRPRPANVRSADQQLLSVAAPVETQYMLNGDNLHDFPLPPPNTHPLQGLQHVPANVRATLPLAWQLGDPGPIGPPRGALAVLPTVGPATVGNNLASPGGLTSSNWMRMT